MVRTKNLTPLRRYTYIPKQYNDKPFKISDFSETAVDKQKPTKIPDPATQPNAPTKNAGANRYIIPKRLDGDVQGGPEYPKCDPPVTKPESKPSFNKDFSI